LSFYKPSLIKADNDVMNQIKKIGVIGAGNMGSGIAQKISQEGMNVTIVDIKAEFVKTGIANIENTLSEGVKRRIFSREQMESTLARISGTTDLSRVADADIVIEAVYEDRKIKSELFGKLDSICSEKTILATNTSGFLVSEFAEKISRLDRFIGLHYFYHPAKNRLLEVIPHSRTSQQTIEKSLLAAKLQGKTAILVKDSPGFAVNRFFVPFLNEATRMLQEEIANIPTIEKAYKQAFKIEMGPFELMNITGIPIAVHSSGALADKLGTFYATSDILKQQMDKKEGWNLTGEVDESKYQQIIDRSYGVCLGIAAALVDDGVASIEDIDRGAKIGLRWTMGPFEIMNKIGIEQTCRVVEAITRIYPEFRMPKILLRHRQLGKPFDFRFVDLDVKGDIAYITLNRPEAMNALNEALVSQLDKQFSEAEKLQAVKSIVFQGAGKAFVAGADIRYFINNIKNNKIDDTVKFTEKGHDLFLRIENSKKLTVAVLDGLSLGGGSELALACQAIIATPAGAMGFPETGIGIYPGLGGMLRLAKQIGPELTKYYVFTGKMIRMEEAYALGIVSKLVSADEVEPAIKSIIAEGKPDKYRRREIPEKFGPFIKIGSRENVERLLARSKPVGIDDELASKTAKIIGTKAPIALRVANELIDQQSGKSIPEAIKMELNRLKDIFSTQDALAGLSSAGGEAPKYKGK
jgi:enoyl-CoA hydratase/3-hydroxyacyl-CoA dehydrogenase